MAITGVSIDQTFYLSSSSTADEVSMRHNASSFTITNTVGDFNILNRGDGGNFKVYCDNATGTQKLLLDANPDLNDGGISINGDCNLKSQGDEFYIDSLANDLNIRSIAHGGTIEFYAEDVGGAGKTPLKIIPDGNYIDFTAMSGAAKYLSTSQPSLTVAGFRFIFFDTSTGDVQVDSISDGVEQQEIYIVKALTSNTLTIKHNAGVSGTNIFTYDANDIVIGPGFRGGVGIVKFGDWRVFSK